MVLSLVLPVAMLPIFHAYHMPQAAGYFVKYVIPLSVAVLAAWLFVAGNIRRDIKRARNGEAMHNGLPHHGLMVVISFKFGLAILLWGAQLLVAIGVKNDFYALIFGLGNVVTNILICIDTWVLARIERGVTPEIHSDYDMSKKLKIGFVSGVALAVVALCLIGVYGYFHFLGDVDSNRLRNAHTEQEILASFRDHIAPDVTAGARLRLARHYAKSGRLVEARAQMKLLPDLAAWPDLAKRSQIEQARILVCEGKAADARKLLETVADADTDADLQPLRVEAGSSRSPRTTPRRRARTSTSPSSSSTS